MGIITFSDYQQRQEVTIRAIPRWCVDGHMGALVAADPTTHKSKIVSPAHVDDAQGKLSRAYAVLRSWSIWRSQQQGFASGSAYRQRVFDMETMKLRDELEALGHSGRTGHPDSDVLIMGWTPEVFV